MSTFETDGASIVAIDPTLGEVLRQQTLAVLEFTHDEFEDARDLPPADLLALATVFRDAFVVLEAIGWVAGQQTETVQVTITPGHAARLDRLRADLGMAILDHLDLRKDCDTSEGRAEIDEWIEADRVTARGLAQILRACAGLRGWGAQ